MLVRLPPALPGHRAVPGGAGLTQSHTTANQGEGKREPAMEALT